MCNGFATAEQRKARKDHKCAACCHIIPYGRTYTRAFSITDGSASTDKYHIECYEEFCRGLMESGEDCGDPYHTWENGLPQEIAKTYFHGPWEE